MGTRSLDDAIEASHNALAAIINGDPSGYRALYAEDEVPTLGNPFGPFAHGRQGVFERLSGAAANYEDGEVTGVETIAKYVSDDLACVVEVESYRAKVGGSEDIAFASLRVTSVFRLERGNWKLVHRHADPITTPRPAASIIGGQISVDGKKHLGSTEKLNDRLWLQGDQVEHRLPRPLTQEKADNCADYCGAQ